MSANEPSQIAFFAHERGDARVVKRIAALGDQGWKVLGFTFHRVRDKVDRPPTWENVHLGTTYNRRYLQRLWAFVRCIGVLWKERQRLAICGVIYVVNTDNALLALLGRCFVGKRIPLVLELADVQPAMLGNGARAGLFRSIERCVLRRISLLVTTSPGFVREYFQPIQQHDGEIFLLENKVYPSAELPPANSTGEPVSEGNPWIVGCFGAFRCRRSLLLMRTLSNKLPGKVRFILRGYPAGIIAEAFQSLMEGADGISYEGPYHYPDDLVGMYGTIDFNWAFDESDPCGNSTWLLPNRIYEGGCFGIPAIASEVSETGRWIESKQAGWIFAEPLEETLAAFFSNLDPEEWRRMRNTCSARPRGEFTGDADYACLSEKLMEIRG